MSRTYTLEPLANVIASVAALVCALALAASPAYADRVAKRIDRLVDQLSDSNSKIRISAVTSLGNTGDARAIPALVDRLKRDKDKNVRGLAAKALAKTVTERTSAKLRTRAEKALERVARADKSKSVRKQARDALADITSGAASGGVGIYVNVGAMTAKAGDDKMRKLMRKTVTKTIDKRGASMTTQWPGGKPPDAKQLRASQARGFHVDGTLVTLDAQPKGNMTLVSCKISMLIATYPKKSMFGFLDGGAKVQAGSSDRDVKYAKEDCVVAVVEDLVARKIIPTIQSRKP